MINSAFGTPPTVKDFLDRCRISAVWINRKRETNCVRPDDESAVCDATRYLIEHGHRRIAFIHKRMGPKPGHAEPHYSEQDRLDGYRRAMREAGLSALVEEIPSPRNAAERAGYGMRTMGELLDRSDRATAYLCQSEGYGAYAAALQRGLSIPDDVSLMCIDTARYPENIAIDRALVNYRSLGRTAVEVLCKLIDAPDQPQPAVVIPFDVHRAGTVGRPND